jgi:hypothetical protein
VTGKPVSDWLRQGPESGSLARQAAHLMNLQRIYAGVVPAPLAAASQVVSLRDGILHVTARNGAVAAKLMQMAPTLAARIHERDRHVNQIHVAVQGNVPGPPPAPPKRARVPDNALPAIEALAGQVADPGLREALERLAIRHRRQGGGRC